MRIVHPIMVYLGLAVSAIGTLVLASILISFNRFFPSLGGPVQRWWGRLWCLALGIRVKVLHLDRAMGETGIVIVPNHESMFDILVMASLPISFRWISKEQVGRIPFVGGAMRALGSYFLKRDRSAVDFSVMKEVEKGLCQGNSVIIFPEGTRTRTGELLPIKKGAFRTAQNAGARLLPVAISGTFQIAAPGKLPTRWGHSVVVCIGSAMAIPAADSVEGCVQDYLSQLKNLLVEARSHLREVL